MLLVSATAPSMDRNFNRFHCAHESFPLALENRHVAYIAEGGVDNAANRIPEKIDYV